MGPSMGETFSNVLAPGLQSRLGNQSQILSSYDQTSNFNSAVPYNYKTNTSIQMSTTPNKTGRTYDSQMEQFGVKMGFGAVTRV